ncbi:MAG: hypothetical protein EOP34_04730 [Rickettsiales bacterium]|nr:MAG: hypothetical protein EOP34_04730 [Rickettsiales bacterium]
MINNNIKISKFHFSHANRPLVIYTHVESPITRRNILFFMKHGLHSAADFIFIINVDSDIDGFLPENTPNIRIVKTKEKCLNRGSIGGIIGARTERYLDVYSKFIIMSSNLRGPFLPLWSTECWTDRFISKLNDETKLVGTGYSCTPTHHVIAPIFATDNAGMRLLINGDPNNSTSKPTEIDPYSTTGLSRCYPSIESEKSAEISFTNIITRASYKAEAYIAAALAKGYYEDCYNGDVMGPNSYFGHSVHPYEIIFVDMNKEHLNEGSFVNKMSEWHEELNYNSWNVCSGV